MILQAGQNSPVGGQRAAGRWLGPVDGCRTGGKSGRGQPPDERGLVAAVNRVIDQRAVTTLFQPLVDLVTTEVVGYEALTRALRGARWNLL